ncbi:MAG TPA: hypothetical protein VII13_03050 [Vicinamibacteria bacterium]|jgi:hypothetical protein
MGRRGFLAGVAALALCAAAGAGEAKGKKPRLDLRSTPKFAFSPVVVLLTAELQGGDDVEELYCPEVEWEFDDGAKSVNEGDCEPFQAGVSKLARRFTAEHEFSTAGSYNVKLTMRKAGRVIAAANTRVTVRAGLGDPTMEN